MCGGGSCPLTMGALASCEDQSGSAYRETVAQDREESCHGIHHHFRNHSISMPMAASTMLPMIAPAMTAADICVFR